MTSISSEMTKKRPTRDGDGLQKTVLVAEDDGDVRYILREAIADQHVRVLEAATAEEAMSFLQSGELDLAIVDIFMPGRGGVWLIQELRARYPDAKIIAVSGGHGQVLPYQALEEARKSGAVAFITKPFDLLDYKRTVLEHL